jgi:hypothetical protein
LSKIALPCPCSNMSQIAPPYLWPEDVNSDIMTLSLWKMPLTKPTCDGLHQVLIDLDCFYLTGSLLSQAVTDKPTSPQEELVFLVCYRSCCPVPPSLDYFQTAYRKVPCILPSNVNCSLPISDSLVIPHYASEIRRFKLHSSPPLISITWSDKLSPPWQETTLPHCGKCYSLLTSAFHKRPALFWGSFRASFQEKHPPT